MPLKQKPETCTYLRCTYTSVSPMQKCVITALSLYLFPESTSQYDDLYEVKKQKLTFIFTWRVSGDTFASESVRFLEFFISSHILSTRSHTSRWSYIETECSSTVTKPIPNLHKHMHNNTHILDQYQSYIYMYICTCIYIIYI